VVIDALLRTVRQADAPEAERTGAHAALRGHHGFLAMIYERSGARRPPSLIFDIPEPSWSRGIEHLDELWY
jgi:hypothetical protein